MRILLCDDDSIFLSQLEAYIQSYFKKNKYRCPDIVTYTDAVQLFQDQGEKDMVFLDVEMPGISGIDAGKALKQSNPDLIIFIITAYSEYLDDAMRFQVFRYLTKPLDKQRLYRNLQDAISLYNAADCCIAVETKEMCVTVKAQDIVYVETNQNQVTVHTTEKNYKSTQSMKFWRDKLTMGCFFITHRSFIVNMEYVSDFDHFMIRLNQGRDKAYLSRRKYTAFKDAYLLYLESVR